MGWAQTSPTPADGDVQAVRAGLGALLEEPHLAAYCTDAVVQKYLVARKRCVCKATKALAKTLHWRQQFRPDLITWEQVKHAGVAGRVQLMKESDKEGRPIVMYRLRCAAPPGTTHEEYIRYWIYVLESASLLANQRGVGKVTCVFDLEGYGATETVMPPFQTRLEALWMAQQYYPESLAHGYVCYPPLLFNVLWRAAQPFLDAVTKDKLTFCGTRADAAAAMLPHIRAEDLYASLGGQRADEANSGVWSLRRACALAQAATAQVDAEAMGAWMSSLDAMRAKQQAEVDAAAAANGGTAAAAHATSAVVTNGAAAVTPVSATTVTA